MTTLEGKAALGEEAIKKSMPTYMTQPPTRCLVTTLQHPLPNSSHNEETLDEAGGKCCHAARIIHQLYLDAFKFQEV